MVKKLIFKQNHAPCAVIDISMLIDESFLAYCMHVYSDMHECNLGLSLICQHA